MSCDDISRYSVSSQSGSKGSEAVSYYLDQDSGQYFSLLEGDGPPGPDYDRGRNTGVRRRDKTPTHGKRSSVTRRHGWSRNGSGSVFVMEKKNHAFSHNLSHLFFSPCSQSSSLYVCSSPASWLCSFVSFSGGHMCQKQNKITRQTVNPNKLSPAPCLPHHLCPPSFQITSKASCNAPFL